MKNRALKMARPIVAGSTEKLVFLAMLLAMGVMLGIFESVYLPPLPIPGAKLGLANIITLILVIYFKPRDAVINVTLRVVLTSLLTGTFASTIFFFSLAGALTAYVAMVLVFRLLDGPLTSIGISVIGGVAHNLAQLFIAVWLLGTWGVFLHLPFLMITGVATGAFNGMITNILRSRKDLDAMLRPICPGTADRDAAAGARATAEQGGAT